jgi:hypothetical protein
MPTSDSIKFAGDVSIDYVTITTARGFTQNVTQQVIGIEYFEDMFSPFITGHIIVKDTLDLANLFPLLGEEYLDLKFQTPTLETPISGQFYIHKMSDRIITGDRQTVYELHFISKEAVVDLNKSLSQTFRGKISDIARSLFTDSFHGLETPKQLIIEETSNDTAFIANWWKPSRCLEYMTRFAMNQNSVPSYIFYENNNGFNYVSLEKLYQHSAIQQFTHDKYTRDEGPFGSTFMNIGEDYKRILDLSIPVSFDYISRLSKGMVASSIESFDITRKVYSIKQHNMFERFYNQKHLNNNPVQSSGVTWRNNAYRKHVPKQSGGISGFGEVSNYKVVAERTSLMEQAGAHKIEITVPGRTDYLAGSKVYVDLKKMAPVHTRDLPSDLVDEIFSGNYLISAINHSVTREKHECHMELMKDSLMINTEGSN